MSIVCVTTNYGKIKGIAQEGYTLFKGIPYAKPPVGELRWRAPQEMEPWDGIYQADRFSDRSMQETMPMDFYDKEFYSDPDFLPAISEDSLSLNVWTPADGAGDQLPVMFYIHGGAFMGGYGSEMEFDGAKLCARGAILVTINYRLNIFGFLAHPWFAEENEQHAAGNYGILDQIAALRWVHENITAFGGNPDNITVLGQSAGAMSVQTLVSSSLSGQMIAKAIMQSGGGYDNGMNESLTMEEAFGYGKRFVELTGAKNVQELRRKTPKELYQAMPQLMKELMESGKGLVFKPIVDDYVLTGGYDELIEKGMVKKIPYILGSNQDDIFVRREDVQAGIKSRLYNGCVTWSHLLADNGHNPSYVYYFKRHLPGDDAGAFHSSELWYTFGTLGRCWRPMTDADFRLSERMMDYWVQFAKTGRPDTGEEETWKPCTPEDPFVKIFDV